jgi:predicted nuclease of predicted toxin-antitoxin system
MIIADENVEKYRIDLLRNSNYQVYSIREIHPGISDTEIIALVKNKKSILLKEDKDFGELVFAHSFRDISIIFLRYDQPLYDTVEKQLRSAIELYHDSDMPVFVTVTKIRHVLPGYKYS